ncbi:MAG: hypothetical protein FWD64_08340, partial [Acidobacteriaceae bacterium]|nr:hypothetical protein [Acidobacteriaceae bacterium]
MAERYIRLFVNNHRAYSQMTDHKDKPSSNRYFRPRIDHNNPNSEYKELTVETVRRHLHGSITCMFYAIDPQTQWSKWTCIDADYDNADPDILVLAEALENDGVPTLYETSRRGAHLWILHEVPLPAVLCRAYVTMLAKKHDVPIKGERLVSPYKEVVAKLNGGDVEAKIHTEQNGIESFPRQDMLAGGTVGKGIRRPLAVHRKTYQRRWCTSAE